MNEKEILGIMASDMKLWDKAVTSEEDGVLIKTLKDLPWGIGDFNVRFEGVSNADQRRAAVNQFGQVVRDEINSRIDDEIVSARAAQKVASYSDDSDREVGGDSTNESTGEKAVGGSTIQTFEGEGQDFGSTIGRRVRDLQSNVKALRQELRLKEKELAALEAALKVFSADETEEKFGSEM